MPAITKSEKSDLNTAQRDVSRSVGLSGTKVLADNLLKLIQKESLKEIRSLIKPAVAFRYKIVPFGKQGRKIIVATAIIEDVAVLDEIRWVLGTDTDFYKAEPEQIEEALRYIYGLGAEAVGTVTENEPGNAMVPGMASDLDADSEEASVVRFVNELLSESIRERASDIHIEPFEKNLRIRYRIDGILYEIPVPETLRHLHTAIVSRIKIMANLNIAEQRLPQDGRIKVKTSPRELDLRISTLPTPFGESVNIRILNNSQVSLDLTKLGMLDHDLETINYLLAKPHGIVLVTGPTGSGKTTTLYSCLNRLNEAERKIITVEDPIEYQLPGITQIQVNPKIGLTFAQGLRSMLRHDPDVMLVGEIRDHETAEVTIQVAMTGHLVFSTLHTNDASNAVARLINMGIEPYLIAASVECIIAQRLVRKICPYCRKIVSNHNGQTQLVETLFGENAVIYKGEGCEHCKNTGYFGRTAIYEFLMIDEELRSHIIRKTSANHLRQIAVKKGMCSLRKDGIRKILNGITTLDEVLRVTQEVEE